MKVCIEQLTDLCVELKYPNWLPFCPICGWITIDPRTLVCKKGEGKMMTMEEFEKFINGPYQYIQNCRNYNQECFTENTECETCLRFKEKVIE